MSVNESAIRSGETPSVLQMISYNPTGRVLTWRFVRSHWKMLYDRWAVGPVNISRLPKVFYIKWQSLYNVALNMYHKAFAFICP